MVGEKNEPIPVHVFQSIVEDFLERASQRDPEAIVRAKREMRPGISVIYAYPDLAEQFDRALLGPFPCARSQVTPCDPSGPEALKRSGSERIFESPWKNPLPESGLAAAQLAQYWAWALETRMERLAQSSRERPEDVPAGDGYRLWLKERRVQIRMLEAVLELLHRIVAPEAAYLCGAACNHLGDGLDAVQLKRFLDSLDAYRARTDYESPEHYTVECARRKIDELMVAAAGAPAP